MDQSDLNSDNENVAISLPWLLVTAEDIASVDIDLPISSLSYVDTHLMSAAYSDALAPYRHKDGSLKSCAEARTFNFLEALTSMMLKPTQPAKPFTAMMILEGGARTAVPEDFRSHVNVLEAVVLKTKNVGLRARASDVCWLIRRSKSEMGFIAVKSYNEIIQGFQKGTISHPHIQRQDALTYDSRDILRRAMQIGKSLGFDKEECQASRRLVRELREQSLAIQLANPAMWFSELDLDFDVSDPRDVAHGMKRLASAEENDNYRANALWRLAARAYHQAKDENEKNGSRLEAVNRLISQAEDQVESAMLAAHFYQEAINQLSHVPDQKKLRAELRHKLVRVQADVVGEMKRASVEVDLTELIESTEKSFLTGTLLQKMMLFASLQKSPTIADLREAAIRVQIENPLSAIIPTQHLDREGKVVFRSDKGIDEGGKEAAILDTISRNEAVRRKLVVSGAIEVARRAIVLSHYVSDDLLEALLQFSPAVPPELTYTYAHGFCDFFNGDYVSATYILTPLLEASLRLILKKSGHDVTILIDDTQTQEDISLSQIFQRMESELTKILGEPMVHDFYRVFVMKPGPYLRHALAHGLLSDNDPFGSDAVYGCWLFFRLCMLPLVAKKEELGELLKGTELLSGV